MPKLAPFLLSPEAAGRLLPDKGKPVVRRGRKATGQVVNLIAGLPKEGQHFPG